MSPLQLSEHADEKLSVVTNQTVLGRQFCVYGTVEDPLFLAKDVAEWIDYAYKDDRRISRDVSKMLASVDEDEKAKHSIRLGGEDYSHGGVRENTEMWFLTENGLYEVLMLSRKPIAKEFKREVKKILHDLRLGRVPKSFAQALRLAAEQQERIEAQQERIEAQQALIEQQQPKVAVYDELVDRSKTMNFRDMAARIGMRQSEFMAILKARYIYKNSVGEYRAYAEYQKYFTLRTFTRGVDKTGEQLMLSMEGINYFINRYKPESIAESWLKKECIEQGERA